MSRLTPLVLAAGAGSCLCALLASSALAQLPKSPDPDKGWAQTLSDLRPESDIRFGVLPNGMRYAILHNATPAHQASLRLRIGSGSLEESADEQGLAHVLEHMAFKGSVHVPNGDMVKILERHGLAFGPDTNAQTGFTETDYMLDLPETDPDTVGTGLMLLRDIAGGLTLSPTALEPERGVVLSEERLRDTPAYEAMKAQLAFEFQGQLAADRLPIGKVPVIKTAPASLIRKFYQENYRPDRATLIAVGDFDPAAMEAEIKARFSDWRPVGPETASPELGQPEQRGTETLVVQRPGVTPEIDLDWLTPFDGSPDTAAKRRRDRVESIALAVLNRRLERLSHAPGSPFIVAQASRSDELRSAKVTELAAIFRSGQWKSALDAVVRAQKQALQYGVRQDEIEREVAEQRVLFVNAAAGAATRRTPDLANALVQSVDQWRVFTSPAEDLALFEQEVKGLDAATVNAALRAAFQGSGPLAILITPDAVEGGDAALRTAFRNAEAVPVPPPDQHAVKAWSHTDFGPVGKVASRREIADLGVSFVRFANGVRLTVKPTTFRKDQVLVDVHFGHGRLELPKDRTSLDWAVGALPLGGLDDMTFDEIQQAFASNIVSAELSVGDDSFQFKGETRPKDLDPQLQLLAAFMTRPGWRPEGFQQIRDGFAVRLAELETTPQGVEARDLPALLRDGDARWKLPTIEEVKASTPEAFKSFLQSRLAEGPLEVEVIGDVTVDQAVAAVARTFGALPPRAAAPPYPGALAVSFPAPAPAPVLRTHRGRSDQAIAYEAWPIPDLLSDTQRSREVSLATQVMELRILDQVRVAEGATYSPTAAVSASATFPGYGYAYAAVEIPPAKIGGFYADVSRIEADLAARGVTADELERARRPRIETIRKGQQTNEYWETFLHDAEIDPRRLELIRSSIPGYERLTPADLQRAAASYLTEAHGWRFEVEPVNPSAAAPPNAAAIPAAPVPVKPTPPATPEPSSAPKTRPLTTPPAAAAASPRR